MNLDEVTLLTDCFIDAHRILTEAESANRNAYPDQKVEPYGLEMEFRLAIELCNIRLMKLAQSEKQLQAGIPFIIQQPIHNSTTSR